MRTLVFSALVLISTSSRAAIIDEPRDENLADYEQIVRDLQKEVDRPSPARTRARVARPIDRGDDPFAHVLFHFGVGATTRSQTVSLGAYDININAQGVQAAFGIDLLSNRWLAEGTVRKFESQPTAQINASLSEFELKVFYRESIAPKLIARAGFGLSGRYSTIVTPEHRYEDTTPTAVATLGLDFYANSTFSFGIEGSARSGLISETTDKASMDATLRLDTHF